MDSDGAIQRTGPPAPSVNTSPFPSPFVNARSNAAADVHATPNVVNDAVVRPTISRRLATDSTVMGNDGTIQERLEKSERMGSTYFEPKNTTINLG